jgi:hypothetical protein
MITSTDRQEQIQRLCDQLVGGVFVTTIEHSDEGKRRRISFPTLVGEEGAPLYEALTAVAQAHAIWITHACPPGYEQANGMYDHLARTISIKRQAQLHMTKTLAHELAHAFDRQRCGPEPEVETVAEAVAYLVLAFFGLDSSLFSFRYIAAYNQDNLALLLWCLPRIQRLALAIIDQTSAHLAPAAPRPDPWDHALALAQASAPGC